MESYRLLTVKHLGRISPDLTRRYKYFWGLADSLDVQLKGVFPLSRFRSANQPQEWSESGHRYVIHRIKMGEHIRFRLYLECDHGYLAWICSRPPAFNPAEWVHALAEERRYKADFVLFEGAVTEQLDQWVLVWDRGSCLVETAKNRQAGLAALVDGFKKGHISFVFEGQKLKGGFELRRKKPGSDRWTLHKVQDRFAARDLVRFEDESVVSQTLLEDWLDMGAAPHAIWETRHGSPFVKIKKARPPTIVERLANPKERDEVIRQRLSQADLGFRCNQLDKIYYPQAGLTKLDILAYYYAVAQWMLPYMAGKPVVAYRFPFGIDHAGAIHKPLRDEDLLPWMQTAAVYSDQSQVRSRRYLLADDERTLFFFINRSGLEFASWTSAVGSLERPAFVLLNLRIADQQNFALLADGAMAVAHLLRRLGLKSFCRLTGLSTNLHICLPLNGIYPYQIAHKFFANFASYVMRVYPTQFDLGGQPEGQRITIDLNALQQGRSVVVPYSLRADPQATVVAPIKWSELEQGARPQDFTIDTMIDRLRAGEDQFKVWQKCHNDLKIAWQRLRALAAQSGHQDAS
jgi:DNA ligase D-like protein (predicted polymerase)